MVVCFLVLQFGSKPGNRTWKITGGRCGDAGLSQRLFDLDDFIAFNDIANFDIVEVFDRHPTFQSGSDLFNIFFEAFEGSDLAMMPFFGGIDNDTIPDQADTGISADLSTLTT